MMVGSIPTTEVNSALQIFMEKFGFYFNTVFPYKLQNFRNIHNNKWITKGIQNSTKRMLFLNSVKRKFSLSREAQAYIKVLKEAKKEKMIGTLKGHLIKQKNGS
jgi:hypothetical protein